ncbi:unnamed protein product, partial [Rotaria sp. Silwood2]
MNTSLTEPTVLTDASSSMIGKTFTLSTEATSFTRPSLTSTFKNSTMITDLLTTNSETSSLLTKVPTRTGVSLITANDQSAPTTKR